MNNKKLGGSGGIFHKGFTFTAMVDAGFATGPE
jgi:hypothetical protein